MFEILIKKFVPNYQNVNDSNVRESYGKLTSIISIVLNFILVAFKLIFGYLSNSISIIADGLNNLSDIGSNVATFFGFKLASRHPDSEHPYGHGRIEYVIGLLIAFLIMYVGITSIKESFIKLFKFEPLVFSYSTLIVLIVSILIKFWMGYFNHKCAKKINSTSLFAASKDSYNDALSTSGTLIALILSQFTNLPVDPLVGIIVSIIVLKSGFEIFSNTTSEILGLAPSKDLVEDISKFILSFDVALGIHDLMIHDYGPSRRFMSVHVEVDAKSDILLTHDAIDLIEKALLDKFGIFTTIHMDPIAYNDEKTNKLKANILSIVNDIDPKYSIHDFRIVDGPSHTNILFDLVLPSEDQSDHKLIKTKLEKRVKQLNPNYCLIIEVEHSYV